ncbi:inorganic diphosphatase [Rickettsiaceae bacterium]|nr:inorganic diphosphatase [Rickettsiaceae bacterium]
MNIDKIPAKTKNGDFNIIIEIPMNDNPVKYEFDKDAGAIIVDRFIPVSMSYPCNYGFIPHTLSNDGDPADVLVISQYPLLPASIITVRPVGVLIMEDESGMDEKILALPISKIDPTYDSIQDIDDVPDMLKRKINHFFEYYKKLEKGKWVKVVGWEDARKAKSLIQEAVERFDK